MKKTTQMVELKCLAGYTEQMIAAVLKRHIGSELDFVEDGFEITELALAGSWVKGTNRPDSDLDVILMYDGCYREDDIWEALNGEPLYIGEVKVDFIPCSNEKGSDRECYFPLIPLSVAS